ncbi:Myb-like DNA-binding domain containing protein [Trichomonas vaginalis G3]|uniref:Myb-like DNA-binding domain containing protein n=1 Tax=Trichomonas vaginalis (strain ATCC PRA-98 / G3) TaxID=412133 RepID=A2DE39_TRIV3|nr:RNA polymerase II transcription regulator recruiting protein [Trichomonas vaginalis G3]EAY21257.1 Myb-like DNA-binding domain containing protein [Trichomonas vaginalis G3]KAI5548831.1 RNA polymerase II transcription regulator recruiting protein [Trichomonas vaginalis G3]|eukprot:XP_001582243.1 Myb-like DNA-binding domain containing protein [Trichomonas vaginalis G3]
MSKREIHRFSKEEDDKIIAVFKRQKENTKRALDILEKRFRRTHTRRAIFERFKGFLSQNRDEWTKNEDKLILESYKIYGNKWAIIAKFLKNRSGDQVKIRHKQLVRKNDPRYRVEEPAPETPPNTQKQHNEDFWTNVLTNFDIDEDQIKLLFI